MDKNKIINVAMLLLVMFAAVTTRAQTLDDIVIEGTIVAIDSPRVFSIRGKQGYTHNYCFLHLKVRPMKGDSVVTLVRVFNMHVEAEAYAVADGLKTGDMKKFRVYEFTPCVCGLPRVDGYCEQNQFVPIRSKVIQRYSMIYRIISYD